VGLCCLIAPDGRGALIVPDCATIHVADNLSRVSIAMADNTAITVGEPVCFDDMKNYELEGGPFSYT
jgi:hypothetical protein